MPILPEEISVYILPDVNHPLPTYTEGCLRTPILFTYRCGGVSTRVIKRRIQRVPYFVTDSMQQAQKLSHWLLSHFDELKAKAEEVSQHCKLQSLQPWFIGW